MFALFRARQFTEAEGLRHRLPTGPAASLEQHVETFLQGPQAEGGPPVLVGALPFDVRAPAYLYQPEEFRRGSGWGMLAGPIEACARAFWAPFQIASEPDPESYAAMVRRALDMIGCNRLTKVVLSRSLCIRAAVPVDPLQVAARLARDPDATTFMLPLPPDTCGDGPSTLVGATPELLVSRRGTQVVSHPLAGSARRRPDRAEDEAAAQALLHSDKDRREHMFVVEAILDILAPHCQQLGAPAGTTLYSTTTMWHLGTRIEGVLRDDAPSAAGLAALLHPTPAVGGSPRCEALEAIRALEPRDRGFYAGAVGWSDVRGDGEWHVALRCAEICGARLRLQAGAGIVAGSDPEAEVAETRAKFQAMLRAIEMEQAEDFLETAL